MNNEQKYKNKDYYFVNNYYFIKSTNKGITEENSSNKLINIYFFTCCTKYTLIEKSFYSNNLLK